MSAQTSYDLAIGKALAGLLYAQHPSDIVSRKIETAAGIAHGVVVSRGTNDDQVVVGGATALGITLRSLDKEGAANTGDIQWDEHESAPILRSGYVWAVCPAGCSPGDSVLYTTATGVLDSGTAGAGETQLANATWELDAAAGELSVIRLKG